MKAAIVTHQLTLLHRTALALITLLGLMLTPAASQAQIAFRAASSATVNSTNTVFASGAGNVGAAASGNVTPGLPGGWYPGDLFLAVIESRDNVAATLPADWTLLDQGSGASGLHQAALYWKRAATGDTAPLVTHGGGGAIIARIYGFRGVDLLTPFDATPSYTASAADLTSEAAAITTVSSARLVSIAQIANISSSNGTLTGSSPWYGMGYSSTGTSDNGVSINAYYADIVNAGTQAALTLTHTHSGESHGSQLALRVGTTLPIAKPAGTVANDVMVASLVYNASTVVDTAPAGWTLVRRVQINSSVLATYIKTAGASEPAQYLWTLGGTTGANLSILSFSGVDPLSPIDVENGQTTAAGATHATPSLTTGVANAMLVSSIGYQMGSRWTPPAGMTEAVDVSAYPAPWQMGGSLEVSYAVQPAAGASGAKTATIAVGYNHTGVTHLLALKPAPLVPRLYFIHPDHLGTPRLVTDEQNNVVWRNLPTTEPFGNTPPEEDPNATGNRFEMPLAFAGQYRDRESGLSYNYFRDYSSGEGRYRQSDPIGVAGGINTYGYVGGNPVSYIDPKGLQVAPAVGATAFFCIRFPQLCINGVRAAGAAIGAACAAVGNAIFNESAPPPEAEPSPEPKPPETKAAPREPPKPYGPEADRLRGQGFRPEGEIKPGESYLPSNVPGWVYSPGGSSAPGGGTFGSIP